MIKNKVELLAPAGDLACFKAAINAGADAVYLGGSKFGARAYANNFTDDEILEALHLAHLFGKKIYLTVNTLVKEKEIAELVPYVLPLYEGGLDGVIVQDIGVFRILKENFPKLELHASTQMTVTGIYGAEFLKELGFKRIVPARELSLSEIKHIKEKTGLEIETFIHGAMCYSYSGQCLFSSILGGRSGNRGRCAGPCRLPYVDNKTKKEVYPLSLKDMYTLSLIPQLIDAGIDSFKIEGRMKSPEYVAGVTSIYRKYIDMYINNPDKPYKISKADEDMIRGLYIRSDTCQGYYEQHNGKNMVTLQKPGYSGCAEDVLQKIREKYINIKKTISVVGDVIIRVGEPALLKLSLDNCENHMEVTVEGDIVSKAQNRPLSKDDIQSRISKLGDTCFYMQKLTVNTDNDSFLPVKALNELRRKACESLETDIINKYDSDNSFDINESTESFKNTKIHYENSSDSQLFVLASTMEQLKTVVKYGEVSGVYVSVDILLEDAGTVCKIIEQSKNTKFYIVLPNILRERSYHYLDIIEKYLKSGIFDGVLVRNHESYQWLKEIQYSGGIISDYTIYAWNRKTVEFYRGIFDRTTIPMELNRKEIEQLCDKSFDSNMEILLYGRLPLMVSANCVRKTLDKCILNSKNTGSENNLYYITDRYHNQFPVLQNCHHCYNVLYNTVPLSLHNQMTQLLDKKYAVYRLEFTIENESETIKILDYFCSVWNKKQLQFPLEEFTNGHFKRGVE